MKLNCYDRFDKVQFMIETRQDNDVTYHTTIIYTEIKIELSWPIR